MNTVRGSLRENFKYLFLLMSVALGGWGGGGDEGRDVLARFAPVAHFLPPLLMGPRLAPRREAEAIPRAGVPGLGGRLSCTHQRQNVGPIRVSAR